MLRVITEVLCDSVDEISGHIIQEKKKEKKYFQTFANFCLYHAKAYRYRIMYILKNFPFMSGFLKYIQDKTTTIP